MKTNQSIVEAFTELAPRYTEVVDSELNRFWGWSYVRFVDLLLSATPVQPQDKILDIATGTGVIPSLLEKGGHPRRQIHGLDITLAMLLEARRRSAASKVDGKQNLVCASAHDMPYVNSGFTKVFCGLATHHMDVNILLKESFRVLQKGGNLTIADVGGSDLLKNPIIRFMARIFAFCYFILYENVNRAWAESTAVSNVLSKEDWNIALNNFGFRNIFIQKLQSRFFWVPAALLIKAEKPVETL
jgi:ubiquinone/menaquinone biosynthesis C-methylase UbiE